MESQNVQDLDQNFKLPVADGGIYSYVDVREAPFEKSGFHWYGDEKVFCRLPEKSLPQFSESIQYLARSTSGGMVRFRTDSPTVSLRAELFENSHMSHMPLSGSSGFDFYVGSGLNKLFVGTAMPEYGVDRYESVINARQQEMYEMTLNFPLYSRVKSLHIGLIAGSKLEKPTPFSVEKPVVFYGSSITQGGCASRPGNAYTHIVSRWLDANMINLGFSGNALGEPEMAQLIASIAMSVFIMDYDHNASDIAYLNKTHEPFFKIIRNAQPTVPIVFVSRPDFDSAPEVNKLRREVIYATYINAQNAGDNHVFFVDGQTLFGVKDRDACTVDGCHPNDLGFMRMAEAIFPVVKGALNAKVIASRHLKGG